MDDDSPTATVAKSPTNQSRRKLNFQSLDDVLADLDFLEGQPLAVLGNWSVGQNLAHLAIPMNGAIDGMNVKMPLHVRLGATLLKRWIIKMKMPAGFKLPPQAAKILTPGPTSDAEGFDALRRAIARLQSNSHREPHPVLGKLNVEQWNQIMCRHCELHLSFIVPRNANESAENKLGTKDA